MRLGFLFCIALAPPGADRGFEPSALEGRPEFAVYATLKLHAYGQASRTFQNSLPDRPVRVPLPPVSSRRLRKMLAPSPRGRDRQQIEHLDFYDISSCALRERLKSLNHGHALKETGRGVRNAKLYRWHEPIDPSSLQSFRALKRRLGDRLHYAFDVYRLDDEFGDTEFETAQAVDVFRRHRNDCVPTGNGKVAASASFASLVRTRLGELTRHRLLSGADRVFRLTPDGEAVSNWFGLFVHSAKYDVERAQFNGSANGLRR